METENRRTALMWVLFVLVTFAASSTSNVIYFPSEAACKQAQQTLTVGLQGMTVETRWHLTCMPVEK